MAGDDPTGTVAAAILDGDAVDWDRQIAEAPNDVERRRLQNLRIVHEIKAAHAREASDDSNSSWTVDPLPQPPPAPARPPKEGERWGRYEVLEQLGAGSFGTVHRGRDTDLGRDVAIKFFIVAGSDSSLRQRVLLEGQRLARLKDPNIVTVWDVGEHDGQFGLVMEFIEGKTLDELVNRRQTLSVRETVLVGQDVLRALATVHAAGVIHRDVKARNIMRDHDGRIVLMDFGTGRELDEPVVTGAKGEFAGTPLYMAPEIYAGQHATVRSDLYSVGVLLYYLVSGDYPATGRTKDEIQLAHMYGKRTPISHRQTNLPLAFVNLMNRALAPNPDDRYASAADMLDDLSVAIVPGPAPVPGGSPIVAVGASVAAAVSAATAFGAVNTFYFNATLGRTNFATEGLRDWFIWGMRSFVAPVTYALFAVIALALARLCKLGLFRVLPSAKRVADRITGKTSGLGFDNVDHVCGWMLVASIALVVGTYWHFADLIGALFINPDVSMATLDQLRMLSPSAYPQHAQYRQFFVYVVILCAAMWWMPISLARKRREPLNRMLLASGAAVLVIAMLLLSFPYRLLSNNLAFEVVNWDRERCYLLGERRNDALLFCPTLQMPRTATAPASALERTGRYESPFTPFSANYEHEGTR